MADDVRRRMLNRLEAGAGTGACACGGYLASRTPLQRGEICTALAFDRLGRKMRTVERIFSEANENWNQTFYLLYFRTLGDRQNQEAYLSLARRVPYRVVLRERAVPHAVEAMLFGASGLLGLYAHDTYTLDLARSFEHYAAKYDIEPMNASEWALAGIRPANHPVLRLAEAAEFFAQDEFVMDRTMACRTEGDIRRLFCIEASDYWRTHHIPGCSGDGPAQTHRCFQGQHHRHQPRGRAPIRLRQPYGPRVAARQRADAARTPPRRGEPLHARMARGGRPEARQRLRVAGPAAARHGVLRRTALRGVPRRTTHRSCLLRSAAGSIATKVGIRPDLLQESREMTIFVGFTASTSK